MEIWDVPRRTQWFPKRPDHLIKRGPTQPSKPHSSGWRAWGSAFSKTCSAESSHEPGVETTELEGWGRR